MKFVYTEGFFKESGLSEVCITQAAEFVGLGAIEADIKLVTVMNALPADERNALVPLARYMASNADYGFEVGETVRYHFSQHTIREGKILGIEDGRVDFKEVTVPFSLVMSLKPEQISLF